MSEMQSVFNETMIWAVGLFAIGITFREFCTDDVGRWLGRSAVASSVFLLSAFSYYSQQQCQIQYHITSNAKQAKGIINADQTEIDQTQTAAAGTRTLVTAGGTIIHFGTDAKSDSASADRQMPRTGNSLGWNYSDDRHVDGTDRRIDDTTGRSDRYGGRTIGRIRSMPIVAPSLSDIR